MNSDDKSTLKQFQSCYVARIHTLQESVLSIKAYIRLYYLATCKHWIGIHDRQPA